MLKSSFNSWLDASEIMESLRHGVETIAASTCTETECHLELARRDTPSPLSPPELETLEGLLRGDAQKVIGIDAGCAPSTVAFRAKSALNAIGLNCQPKSIPTILLMIAQAERENLPLPGRITPAAGSTLRRTISVDRPQPRACGRLSPAQAQLVDLMIEGTSRQRMSDIRRTSARTIANQLADVYRKFGVTGRSPLLIRLMSGVMAVLLGALTQPAVHFLLSSS